METFGLLKILQSALSSEGQTPTLRQESEPKTSELSTQANEREEENAFVELMLKHEKLSRDIDRKKGK